MNLTELRDGMKINPQKLTLSLEKFIRNYLEKLGREGIILGLSGGIDSAGGIKPIYL